MQLKGAKENNSMAASLGLATAALLGTDVQAAGATPGEWEMDASVLYYSEKERVRVIEPVIRGTYHRTLDETITVEVILDSITGATPTGAVPTAESTKRSGFDRFPSRNFDDRRAATNISWKKRIADALRGTLGLSFSTESDYTSYGINGKLAQDFNQRNTTVTVGTGVRRDTLKPNNAPHEGMTPVSATGSAAEGEQEESKTVIDGALGLTQTLSPSSLAQLNLTLSREQGYLNDPYKLLSVVHHDGTVRHSQGYWEKRPDSRLRGAVQAKYIQHLGGPVLRAKYRYYRDDWEIRSHTLRLRYRQPLGNGYYLQPEWRGYSQTAADFYTPAIVVNEVPEYASADYRLAQFTSQTWGVELGRQLETGRVSLRYFRIVTNGEDHPDGAIGVLQGRDLYPDLVTNNLQASISFTF